MPSTQQQNAISCLGQPVWEIAELFPEQGVWTERQYLALKTNRLVEFDNGIIEILPVPTKTHQLIVLFFFEVLKAFITQLGSGGLVLVAPYRLRIPTGRYREPDVLYLTGEQNVRAGEDFTQAAELVVEVVSPDDPDRDYIGKRRDYALAGIPEYWIVDRALQAVIVLRLENGSYAEHGRFGAGQRAGSHLLPGLGVNVDDVLSIGR
ncbi:MAG TPA: Uma2 family endonuclease [Tepidisphaeraceae bacterium]|nr:Uma2 family endonuclease [Tepidisphaeraceae bacterium]